IWLVFLAGAVTGAIALSGIVAMISGIRRKRDRDREFEYLRQRVAEQEREDDDAADGVREWLSHGQPRARRPGDPAHGPFRPSPPGSRPTPTHRAPQG